jgi:hypothetical protein
VTDAERASRWSRRFVLAGAALLVLWQAAELAGLGRRAAVTLGVLGFVCHTVFGKAYALVPSYFDRDLATPRAMPVHLTCSLAGTLLLAGASTPSLRAGLAPETLRAAAAAGALLWAAGVVAFLGTMGWTLRGNLTGAETATGGANEDRRPVDRAANAFVPIALAYLAVGSYALVAGRTALPVLLDGYPPRAIHLLAAGFAGLLLFAVGFRLLPRFLVARPPRALVATVLPAGAVGPALLAVGLPAGPMLHAGAAVESVAVVGFAAAFGLLFARSDRRRVGFYGVLAAAVAGTLAALAGLSLAVGPYLPGLVTAHRRLMILGFLGLAIVGATYQFYPPAVGTFPGAGNRTALGAIALLAGGLLVETAGLLGGVATVVTVGRVAAALGAAVHLGLLVGLFRERYG